MEIVKKERFGRFLVVEGKETMVLEPKANPIKTKDFFGIGIARRSDNDKESDTIAESIATGRAGRAIKYKIAGKRINNPFMG